MTHILGPMLCAVSLLACVYIYQKWSTYTSFRAAAVQHGCQRPRKYPHSDPIWGYDLHRERTKATQSGNLMKLYERHFELYGKTFEEQFFNTKVINTMEAANIQQAAALSFQDWGKLSSRNASSSPFLGRGIFSEDGAFWKHSRDLIKPTFARSEISDVNSLGVFVDRLLDLIPHDGTTVDIQPLIHKLVLEPRFPPYTLQILTGISFSIFRLISYSEHRWIHCCQILHLTHLNLSRLSTSHWRG